ncbi:hypothetical protein ACW9UR_09810 [Halovulum sp. GXIMD14794]
MKVGLIGNSHLGALRKSFDPSVFHGTGLDFDFWGLPGEFQKIRVTEDTVTHANSRKAEKVNGPGRASFCFAGLDALVLVAEPIAMPLFLTGLRGRSANLEEYSDGFLCATFEDWVSNRPAAKLLRAAREVIDGPLISVAQPVWRAGSRRARGLPVLSEEQFERFNHLADGVLGTLGAKYLPQPQETLTPDFRTRDEWSKAWAAGTAANPTADHAHMSEAYGALVLGQIIAALKSRIAN